MNTNNNTSAPTTSAVTSSILLDLLSQPSTSTDTFNVAPDEKQLLQDMPLLDLESTDDILLLDLSSSSEEEQRILLSTAHPNFWDPELHDLCVRDLQNDQLPIDTPPSLPQDLRNDELPVAAHPSPPQNLLNFAQNVDAPPSPPLSTSPTLPPPQLLSPDDEQLVGAPPSPQIPPPQLLSPVPSLPPSSPPSPPRSPNSPISHSKLPVRRLSAKQLIVGRKYKVWTWEKKQSHNIYHLYNNEDTGFIQIHLPRSTRPTRKQRLAHLFTTSLYLQKNKVNGKFVITFHH